MGPVRMGIYRFAAMVALGAFGVLLSASAPATGQKIEPVEIDKPLLARWGFDEAFGTACEDLSGNGYEAASRRGGDPAFARVEGPFGGALAFRGGHHLSVSGEPDLEGVKAISFSAWVAPVDLSHFREIFRKEDGVHRVLFSFQEDGTILSLGLNIDGYVECDAAIDPNRLLDGNWHHCAATYDGEFMRVYLDGEEIGALERPGVIDAGGAAPGCIGSWSGGETFQGGMDELRIYAAALSAEEVRRLYENGVEALKAHARQCAGGEPVVSKSPLAHWTFNEIGPEAVIGASLRDAPLDFDTPTTAPRIRGVHGNGLHLEDENVLPVRFPDDATPLNAISFSAWAKPTDISHYREIFRRECPERLLFSFQNSGSILSLGLNIDGYVECDAPLQASDVTDGRWHHCAATFDGRWMRVYFDGREIGKLERPGRIAMDDSAPGFIGSSGGMGEFFQGGLDDLRVYGEALSATEIATLHDAGVEAQAERTRAIREAVAALYQRQGNFAETMAHLRRAVQEGRQRPGVEVTGSLVALVSRDFPKDYENFTQYTRANVGDYFRAEGNEFHLRQLEHLIKLMVEYKPLTENQWKRQTPEQADQWREAEAIERKFEALRAGGEAAQFSPEWVNLILEAGPRVQYRPYVSEAVAPYVEPHTPPTRALSANEARETLERDWLHQADGAPTPERIKQEIRWAREMAGRIVADHPEAIDFAPDLERLAVLERTADSLVEENAELYFEVRDLKRHMMFRDPVIDFDRVLFVDMPYPAGSEWAHETRHRLGYMAVPGGKLVVLEGLSPAGTPRQLAPREPLHGSFWRPDLSFDGQRVLFCFKPHNEKSFHVYEISIDGSGLRQITDGPYDDLDPIYLPDGEHIIFSTSRAHTYVRCMPPTSSYILARCGLDGEDIYIISRNNEPDYLPSVMNDGRVIYTRWEYTDKPLWRAQSLWTVYPDGAQVNTFWGNQSVWPDLLKDARSIPGSDRVMFTGSAHHGWFSGSVGIIDPDAGLNFPDGLTKITADTPWPESGNGPVDPVESPRYHASGSYGGYYSPYPLSEKVFMVSASRGGKFVLYLMDVDGNRELIYEGANNTFHALPVRVRPAPPVIPERVTWPRIAEERENPPNGVLYSRNVYEGAPDILRGKAKYLRVLNIEPKTYTYWHKRPYISTGPVVSMVQSEGVKIVLGTVPIEADGSVSFQAPPGKALHFQLLDGEYRALQTMRSFTGVMPGERRGCLGCHPMHSATGGSSGKSLPAALASTPSPITPPPWPDNSVGYERYVQTTLDRYCGRCHQGDGKARKTLDLTQRPGFLIFDEPYVTLTGSPSWGSPYRPPEEPPPGFGIANTLIVEGYSTTDPRAYETPEPMTRLSYNSPLVEIASSGKHHGVKVDPISLRRLIVWIDTMCPYRGAEEVRAIPDPEFQGVDWLAVRPRISSAPTIIRPGPVD